MVAAVCELWVAKGRYVQDDLNIRKPFAVIRDEWKGVEVVNYQWLYVWSKRSGDAHDSSA